MLYLKSDPIIALSSGAGNSALGLIRLTSPHPFDNLEEAFSFQGNFRPRRAICCRLVNGDEVLDEIVLNYFPAPRSYTGEFVLELSVHGNQLNINRILRFFQEKYDFRLAEPGEFTYRALKHGKLTLSQVEGLDLLLNANSELGIISGLEVLQGALHEKFLSLRETFIALKASIELSIDFLEDVGEKSASENFEKCLNQFESQLVELYERCRGDFNDLLNPSVVLVGKTNAGKSTLFNKLLKTNRSIVSEEEGTTRDYISEYIFVEGTHFRLIDTAGIRRTHDMAEEEGIARAFELLNKAFYGLYAWNPFEEEGPNWDWLSSLRIHGLVFTHADCEGFIERLKSFDIPKNLDIYISFGPMGPGSFEGGSIGAEFWEKVKGGSIGPLCKAIDMDSFTASLNKIYRKRTSHQPVAAERQRQKIKILYDKFSEFQSLKKEMSDMAVLSSEIELLSKDVDELLGIVNSDDVLDKVFSNFCIGK